MTDALIDCCECEDGWLDDGDGGAWRPCRACHGTARLTYAEACRYDRSREHVELLAEDGDWAAAAALERMHETPPRYVCGDCKRPPVKCEPTCPGRLFAEEEG